MAATMPARTHGLGLITEPLLSEGGMTRDAYAAWNVAATLLGALGCPLAGWIFDRFGLRAPTGWVLAILAVAVIGMGVAPVQGLALGFGLALIGTRFFGQGALSVSSITLMGRWGRERTGPEMATYSVLMTLLFTVLFVVVPPLVRTDGWRSAWVSLGAGLLVLAAIAFLALREPKARGTSERNESGFSGNALTVPVFWLYAVATSLFGLTSSGFALFTEGILAENGHPRELYHQTLAPALLAAFVGQGICAWLGPKVAPHVLLGAATGIYGVALGGFAVVGSSVAGLWALVAVNGLAGGVITVLFFSLWAQTFGQRQLGRIQGAAQACTVVASALGPIVFSRSHALMESYQPALFFCACLLLMSAASCVVGGRLFEHSFASLSADRSEPLTVSTDV